MVIEVEDDGRGIDVARVREVARQRNVGAGGGARRHVRRGGHRPDLCARLLDRVSQVTDLSGRGVGMDVVRTTIERLGGRVSVSSRPQRGTTVRFTLPFTVMMTQVLTVEAAGQVFGVPLEAVVETVRVEPRAPSRRSAPPAPWSCATARFPSSTWVRPWAASHAPPTATRTC